ncbi:hypothetical protein MHA_1905 [Mannheimia haemolytica PHL213]|nr:hypothetical protein MHH_c28470 [Mannheimia haemolytica M42548]EDN74805.1 hypothetical protein MHA_1905 [Mannheimia haemolytica PHL213]
MFWLAQATNSSRNSNLSKGFVTANPFSILIALFFTTFQNHLHLIF